MMNDKMTGPDVKGQLTRSRPSNSRLPDPRAHILHLIISQTSLASRLTELKLSNFLKFITSCQNLLSLDLQVPAVNDDDLWILSKQCRNLESLTLVSVPHLSWARISDEGLLALCKQAKSLRHLHVKLQVMGDLQSQRRTIHEDASSWAISNRSLLEISKTYKGRLTGFGFQLTMHSGNLRDNDPHQKIGIQNLQLMALAISQVIQNNPQLEFLCLDWPVAMNGILQSGVDYLVSLKSLWIGSMFKSTTELSNLIRRNNRLECLRIWELPLNEEATQELFGSFKSPVEWSQDTYSRHLTELELDGLGYLPHLIPPPMAFPNLKRLRLMPSRSAASLHSNATDHLLSTLIRSAPHLESLVVPVLGDEPLLVLSDACQNLQELDVIDGRELTDSALILLVKKCLQLSHLALGSASRITDNGIVVLAKTCGRRLTRLSLPFANSQLTKLSFLTLCHECPSLEALTNVPITKVTFEDLSYAIPRLPHLYILGLTGVNSAGFGPYTGDIDRPKIEQLKKMSKRLKQVILNH